MKNPIGGADDFVLCDFPKPVTVKLTRKWLVEKDELAKEELVNLIYHRLHRRYIVPLSSVPQDLKSGFLMMGVACLLIEALQSFREGREYTKEKGAGQQCFVNFFSQNAEFEPFKPLAAKFYSGIRCGILHQAETYVGWRINRKKDLPILDPKTKSINANKFMKALDDALSKYFQVEPLGMMMATFEGLVALRVFELVARALHYHGPRRHRPFVPLNCAAMPEGLLESELFRHTRGAFTGAAMARRGLFLEASRGTIFLDEIGEMPLGMQAKLLRVLEQRQIRPVGSDREVDIDVRVIAATHRDLAAALRQGTFRKDLYYRLHVMVVQVPPLREHRDDIAFLAETFLQRHATTNHVGARRLTRQALHRLEQYDWPGNVRELSHVIERGVTMSTSEWIDVEDIGLAEEPPPSRSPSPHNIGTAAPEVTFSSDTSLNLDDVTRHLVTVALHKTRSHKGQAAALLGIHPRTLTRMLRRYGLPDAL